MAAIRAGFIVTGRLDGEIESMCCVPARAIITVL
jgi:hypothetical protein